MAALGAFEPRPALAVALSGGSDSLALALLLDRWCRDRGGSLLALTVDHGLRPAAAAEARIVAGWMAERGIGHRILTGAPEPVGSVQATARRLRYRLLAEACRDAGVLHLCVAHTLEDQAETLMLRLARGSGAEGLAAMAPIAERRDLRILRPLLTVPRERLRAMLEVAGQAWLDDPSNRDPRHARVRWRALLPDLAAEGLTPARLAATAARLGRAREALDRQVAACLAAAVSLSPLGYVRLDPVRLAAAPEDVALRAFARVLVTVGAGAHTPRLERLERAFEALRGPQPSLARTLAGCRILPFRDAMLVCREAVAGPVIALPPGAAVLWDRRFLLRRAEAGAEAGAAADWTVQPLRVVGGRRPRELAARLAVVPGPVRPTLPALCDLEGVVGVPHLHWWRDRSAADTVAVVHLPPRPLAGAEAAFACRMWQNV